MKIKNTLLLLLCVTLLQLTVHGQSSTAREKIYFICPPCQESCDTMKFNSPGICPVCGMTLYAAYEDDRNKSGAHHDKVKKKVAILIFPGVEIIDFTGPYEVFGAAGMDVYTVAERDTVITTGMGMKISPNYTFQNAPQPDILVIPGGNVDPSNKVVIDWIKKINTVDEHTLSVCNGAFYLGSSGLLDNLTATTFYSLIPRLRTVAKSSTVVDTVRFADNGHIITSAGLSSGIDGAFHVVSLYLGDAETQKLANLLEYHWGGGHQFVRGKLADKYLLQLLDVFTPFDYHMALYQGDHDKWEIELHLTANLSEEQISRLINFQAEKSEGWTKLNSSLWQFSSDHKTWRAIVQMKHSGVSEYTILLKVARRSTAKG